MLRPVLLILAVFVVLNVVLWGFVWSREAGERSITSTSPESVSAGQLPPSADPAPASDSRTTPSATTTPGAGDSSGSDSPEPETIVLEKSAGVAKPFQTVRIAGAFRGRPETFLQVQRKERGKWLAFPLPTRTDESGKFTAYVELGQPGRYQVRLRDAASGVTSIPFVLEIKG